MISEAAYFLKVNAAIALFYIFYRLFFHNDTFFRLRRFVLLAFFGVAFLYPLLDIRHWVNEQVPVAEAVSFYSSVLPEITVGSEHPARPAGGWPLLKQWALWVYGAGAAGLAVRFLACLAGILAVSAGSRPVKRAGATVYLLEKPSGPFSFFNRIFVYPAHHNGKELEEIVAHEAAHVRQRHSFDVMLGELLAVVCWVNPFVWLLKRELRHNLEYLADRAVLRAGYDSKAYQYHLLTLAYRPAENELYNRFNTFHLKNRIRMMNKARSRPAGRLKYLVFIPLTGALTLLSNIEALARTAVCERALPAGFPATAGATVGALTAGGGNSPYLRGLFSAAYPADLLSAVLPAGIGTHVWATRTPARPERSAFSLYPGAGNMAAEAVNENPDRLPGYPGGDEALIRFIKERICYPAEAVKKGVQGRVICSVKVDAHGRASEVRVERSVDPALDAEAGRAAALLSGWTPGRRNGVPTPMRVTVSVTFRLQ